MAVYSRILYYSKSGMWGMRKKDVIALIGQSRWKAFEKFMAGQTVWKYSNGAFDYYEHDVRNFLRKPKDRFF